jgi:hypothetical protein
MKKNFEQSLDHSGCTIYFLIEVGYNRFIHFGFQDELGLAYYNSLKLEVDESKHYSTQIAKHLYENGLSLDRYRELAWETKVNFSFVDNTPGYTRDEVCLYVYADQIDDSKGKHTLTTLDEMIDTYIEAPDMPHVVKSGIAQILNEREAFDHL